MQRFGVVLAGGCFEPLHGLGRHFLHEEFERQVALRFGLAGVGVQEQREVFRFQVKARERGNFLELDAGVVALVGVALEVEQSVGHSAPERAFAQAREGCCGVQRDSRHREGCGMRKASSLALARSRRRARPSGGCDSSACGTGGGVPNSGAALLLGAKSLKTVGFGLA